MISDTVKKKKVEKIELLLLVNLMPCRTKTLARGKESKSSLRPNKVEILTSFAEIFDRKCLFNKQNETLKIEIDKKKQKVYTIWSGDGAS